MQKWEERFVYIDGKCPQAVARMTKSIHNCSPKINFIEFAKAN